MCLCRDVPVSFRSKPSLTEEPLKEVDADVRRSAGLGE